MHSTLDDHKLETCSTQLLSEMAKKDPLLHKMLRKKNMPYQLLAPYWLLGPSTRWEIIEYNDQDVFLVDQLVRGAGLLDYALETSSRTNTAVTDVVCRGQSIRCWNRQARFFYEHDILLDHQMRRRLMRIARETMTYEERSKFYDASYMTERGVDDPLAYEDKQHQSATNQSKGKAQAKATKRGRAAGPQYKGARLVELLAGYYADVLATLDFEALYPSIIMTFLLCFTTYLPHQDLYEHDKVKSKLEQTVLAFAQDQVKFPTLPEGAKYKCWFWNELDIGRISFLPPPLTKENQDEYVILVVGFGNERRCWVYRWPQSMQPPPVAIVPLSCSSAVKTRKVAKSQAKQAKATGDMVQYNKFNGQQVRSLPLQGRSLTRMNTVVGQGWLQLHLWFPWCCGWIE